MKPIKPKVLRRWANNDIRGNNRPEVHMPRRAGKSSYEKLVTEQLRQSYADIEMRMTGFWFNELADISASAEHAFKAAKGASMFIEITSLATTRPVLVNVTHIESLQKDAKGNAQLVIAREGPQTPWTVAHTYDEVRNMIFGATGDPRYRKPVGGPAMAAGLRPGAL